MQPFRLTLANNGTVTGAHSVPSPWSSPVQHRPLIIGLHGGCYAHHYFDALPKFSASVASEAFGIPFIAIDRPSYGGTSCVLPIPEGSDSTQESAKLLHHSTLPRLWTEFGIPNGCNCIVLLSHSLGVMVSIAVAAMHAQDANPTYPLGGLIASGTGDVQSKAMKGKTPSYPKGRRNPRLMSSGSKRYLDVQTQYLHTRNTARKRTLECNLSSPRTHRVRYRMVARVEVK